MQVITHDQAVGLLDYQPLIDYFEEQHRLPPATVGDAYISDGAGNGLLSRTGFAKGNGLGTKLASIFPQNLDRPTVHSVYVFFNPVTGVEEAVIIGNALTWYKTACDSALGARYLARSDSQHLVMVGAGTMAPHLIKAHLAATPNLQRVTIWNRTPSRAQRLASTLTQIEVSATEYLERAVRSADIVCCATMAVDPLISGEWLQPGTHLDLVGSYLPHMREVNDEAIKRARIFVDLRASALDTGELGIPLTAGIISHDKIQADHYQMATGAPGRTAPDQITLFKNGGGGHLDLMAAQYLMTKL